MNKLFLQSDLYVVAEDGGADLSWIGGQGQSAFSTEEADSNQEAESVTLTGCFQGFRTAAAVCTQLALPEANDLCFTCLRNWPTLRAGGTRARREERVSSAALNTKEMFWSFCSKMLTFRANFKPILKHVLAFQGWMPVLLSVEAINHSVSSRP